jgi:hypothetical protein
MKNNRNNRREFLKKTGMLTVGMAGAGFPGYAGQENKKQQLRSQVFNMSGYAAPKLDVVRDGSSRAR